MKAKSIAVIIILGALAYANAIGGAFLYDDAIFIEGNAYIKNPANLPRIFTSDIGAGAGSGAYHYNFYRPVQMLTYMLDYFLWGLKSSGYHITNILLHVAAAVCVYMLILLLFGDNRVSFLTAAFFAVHPVHTEAVSYISGRADILSALFILLFLICWIKSRKENSLLLFFAALASWCLALLSKEYALVGIGLILPCHHVFRWRFKPKEFGWMTAIGALYISLRTTIFNFPTRHAPAAPEPLAGRLTGFFAAVTQYLKILIAPSDLHMEYGNPRFAPLEPRVVLGFAVIALMLLGLYAWRARRDRETAFFAISWFLIAILPVANIYPINAYMAEHWLYLASIGFFLITAQIFTAAYDRKKYRIPAIALAAALLGYYLCSTVAQNNYWKNPASFYERTLRYGTGSVRIYSNLGLEYAKRGDYEKAIAFYRKAIETGCDTAGAYNNLGIAYLQIKKTEEAMEAYAQAIKANPDFAEAYNNIGRLYSDLGRKEEAVRAYLKAIELNGHYAAAYFNLALERTDPDEAIRLYEKAVSLDPDFAAAYYNISIRYQHLGNDSEAAKFYRKAKSLDPNLP